MLRITECGYNRRVSNPNQPVRITGGQYVMVSTPFMAVDKSDRENMFQCTGSVTPPYGEFHWVKSPSKEKIAGLVPHCSHLTALYH